MAEPISFPEANQTWTGPTEDVSDLPTFTMAGEVISCWKLTDEELEYVKEHGKVWLTVYGRQPPVYIQAAHPFNE